ncbi:MULTISPECIES: rhomboid family intramembrane serine protease [unclassified Streptomyces]|uniref:rhomboid family intramembrane serine protease n=1 Tax=unclassified Streptomyces TaxID=2593676 RepID=UPI00081DA6D4|nr:MULTISPECIES: rhomboid family intramembrane serine protease [unclassified Streptomyces]MYR29232.1 rhomboid family intramembrane serine protease [Streptomyces sp. SID4945]SCF44982.1 Membrane associated serine protease, rhomboid family [Streptomyces sp. LcepLS]
MDPKDQPGSAGGPGGEPTGTGGPEAGAPACYRHPDRETGIRCTRCKRPICTDCMISASVGFQCPDCVRQGGGGPEPVPAGAPGGASAAARVPRPWQRGGGGTGRAPRGDARPRTLAGGVVQGDPRLFTKILIALNLAVFLLVQAVPDQQRLLDDLEMLGRALPYYGADHLVGVAEGEWYRLLTAAFLHQEIWHIAVNMLSLWFLGPAIESMLGRARFLALYLIAAVGGSVTSYLFAAPNAASLGASGAIFGLFGATGILVLRVRADVRPFVALLVINLIITFGWSNIAWQAHIGGLVVGVLVAAGLVYAPRRHRALVQWGTCAVVLAGLVVCVLARTAALT